jgi:uncharacterized alkaline shock family protein YloU
MLAVYTSLTCTAMYNRIAIDWERAKNPKGRRMVTESRGTVRVARQVLITIVVNVALQIPGVVHMAQVSDQWTRFLGREIPKNGVALTIKDNTVSADLYIVVATGVNIVDVGSAIQNEVASAIEEMVGMQVREVNVYIQDVA